MHLAHTKACINPEKFAVAVVTGLHGVTWYPRLFAIIYVPVEDVCYLK